MPWEDFSPLRRQRSLPFCRRYSASIAIGILPGSETQYHKGRRFHETGNILREGSELYARGCSHCSSFRNSAVNSLTYLDCVEVTMVVLTLYASMSLSV